MEEHVVLVNEHNEPIGTAPKAAAHGTDTPLHRGFSVFLFNASGQLLLQQRARTKKTWPLVWSNSCCGHPALNETTEDAARRRLKHELGLTVPDISIILPNYRYRAERDGIVENEFCPVMVATSDEAPQPNPEEVAAVRWVPWASFVTQVRQDPGGYSAWSVEETLLLDANSLFQKFYRRFGRP
jgi:isopentenyl-diphosphate delta-isomerase